MTWRTKIRVGSSLCLLFALLNLPQAWAQDTAPSGKGVFDEMLFRTEPQPTRCEAEQHIVWPDSDVNLPAAHDLFVMFHGNRFPVARALVARFEASNPGLNVAWTSIPPINTFKQVKGEPFASQAAAMVPDVVMLPQPIPREVANRVTNRGLYSRVAGVVALARADADLGKIMEPQARIVLPGQSLMHPLLQSVRSWLGGQDKYAAMAARSNTGYSLVKHHRSVPARILAGCSDYGFQYKQSQTYLEKVMPGRFTFMDLPPDAWPEQLKTKEDSYLYLVNDAPHKANAEKFVNFMLSPSAQDILRDYGLAY